MSDIMEKSIALGDHLYDQYKSEGGGCENLLMEWAKERFYGRIIEDHLQVFDDLWQMLVDKGHRCSKTASSHGDMDYSVWAEKTGKDDDLKVIISTCHCAMRDDNTFLYIRSGFKYNNDPVYGKLMRSMDQFVCATAYPRQTQSRYSRHHKWGDHRDIARPSIHTYRKHEFRYGYRDGRDNTHVFNFSYSHRGAVAEKAHWTENDIPRALDNMQWLLCDLRGDHE